jgi:hypothetical protein
LTESNTQLDCGSPANAGTKKNNASAKNHLDAILIIVGECFFLNRIPRGMPAFNCINKE